MVMDLSKLKPFDLEKAKAGQKFVYIHRSETTNLQFIGVRPDNGSIVYFVPSKPDVSWSPADSLRMLPEIKKVKALLVRSEIPNGEPELHRDTPEVREWFRKTFRTIIQEVKIEYEDD
jgi:hypothetical protein